MGGFFCQFLLIFAAKKKVTMRPKVAYAVYLYFLCDGRKMANEYVELEFSI